ncbi:ATP-binding protein [Acinetobacter baumannii]|uniref:ATP-binding protein n=1 Tax=Acinetobacter baumannii TaxID=470 RepID=UPI00244C239A|nr:ATP-binding protein [Acinetobacter baumannii]MDH2667954.1 ATP-binding protein [Acinetobacter baumannii]
MAIKNYDRKTFGKLLNEVVSPSRPVLSLEHLKGREKQLSRIQQALYATGRNVFIYGERGVGKSSLAATAANEWCGGHGCYIDISCAPDTTVLSMIATIATQAINKTVLKRKKVKNTFQIGFKWFTFKRESEIEYINFKNEIKCLSDGIEILKELSEFFDEPLLVVVDEVDRIKEIEEVEKFADFLKQLGDKRVDVKFIFTGIADTLDEILGSHRSAIRQLETIELPKLSWDARWEIAIEAMKAFDISIDRSIYIRIALISDGYPFYVHLIIEKLLWLLYDKPTQITEVEWEDYHNAIDIAIDAIHTELSRPYEKAINQRSRDYEEVVWSTIVAEDNIGEYIKTMYDQYLGIMKQFQGSEVLDIKKFSLRVRNLLKEEYGPILKNGLKKGQFIYNEKMLRGYVRLRAEQKGVELVIEAKEIAELKNKTQATAKSNKSYFPHPPSNRYRSF